ncbi:MAG: ATP-binding protein [Actinomycetota bacterium]|nr:ATP-binding protein [Actinomycetota bacterium]
MTRRPPDRTPLVGFGLGVSAVVVVTVSLLPVRDHISRALPALLLVLPVVVAGTFGGRLAAVATAVAGAVAFSLGFIPPVGSLRVAVSDDAVALVVFTVVAVAVGTLVAMEDDRRRSAEQRAGEIQSMHARFRAVVAEGEQLRREADRLAVMEQVDAQRAALLRSVSHDLRTPLASIRAVASDLRAGADHSEPVRQELLGLVCDEAERLDRIVANLLSLSRIEAGAFQPDRQAVDLVELVQDVTKRLGRLFDDDDVRLDCQVDAALPLVDIDYVQIDQVLSNLLENAARFAPPGSTVHLSARPDPGLPEALVQVALSDEGPGIDRGELEHVFEPLRTGRASTASGVGLALCKAIVEAHGGMIEATNNPASGARLTFTLPVRHG